MGRDGNILPWWVKPLRKALLIGHGICLALVAAFIVQLDLLEWLMADRENVLAMLKLHRASLVLLTVLGAWVLFSGWTVVVWWAFERQVRAYFRRSKKQGEVPEIGPSRELAES